METIKETVRLTYKKGVNIDGVEALQERFNDYQKNYQKEGEVLAIERLEEVDNEVILEMSIVAQAEDIDVIIADFTGYENILTEVL